MNELTLLVTSAPGSEYRCQVIQSPFRLKPEHRFLQPLREGEVNHLLAYRDAYAHALGLGEKLPVPAPGLGQKEVGRRLARALLGGKVGELFERCLDASDRLRLRLVFDPNDEESPYLASLPWEMIYDGERDQFWGRRVTTPLVRDLEVDHRLKPLEAALPLRILVLRGEDAEGKLDLAGEVEAIEEAWGDLLRQGLVEIATTTDLGEMRSKLRDGKFHVLHYQGHGAYKAASGTGAVFVDPPVGGRTQVLGSFFAEFLQDVGSLRLVFLNTCHGARYAGGPECEAVASVAGGILQRTGVSVLAMQHKITDPAALRFCSDVYERLAKGDPLDVAVTEARLNLARQGEEWAIPVLYLSSKDGRLSSWRRGRKRPRRWSGHRPVLRNGWPARPARPGLVPGPRRPRPLPGPRPPGSSSAPCCPRRDGRISPRGWTSTPMR